MEYGAEGVMGGETEDGLRKGNGFRNGRGDGRWIWGLSHGRGDEREIWGLGMGER